jgi:arylsulfatase A-like enzyme
MNLDIFATVLDLAGLDGAATAHAHSLLDPPKTRVRLSEYPSATPEPIELVKRRHPDFDPTPWRRGLRALYAGEHKLIRGSDGRDELYDLGADPDEQRDQSETAIDRSRALGAALDERVGSLRPWVPQRPTLDRPTDERRRRLEALGYLAPESEGSESTPES